MQAIWASSSAKSVVDLQRRRQQLCPGKERLRPTAVGLPTVCTVYQQTAGFLIREARWTGWLERVELCAWTHAHNDVADLHEQHHHHYVQSSLSLLSPFAALLRSAGILPTPPTRSTRRIDCGVVHWMQGLAASCQHPRFLLGLSWLRSNQTSVEKCTRSWKSQHNGAEADSPLSPLG